MFTFKEWRRVKGFSVKKIAEDLGVNPSTVVKWESGKSKMPVDKALKYCDSLGVKLDDVFIFEK